MALNPAPQKHCQLFDGVHNANNVADTMTASDVTTNLLNLVDN
jgi:hypothetical protein